MMRVQHSQKAPNYEPGANDVETFLEMLNEVSWAATPKDWEFLDALRKSQNGSTQNSSKDVTECSHHVKIESGHGSAASATPSSHRSDTSIHDHRRVTSEIQSICEVSGSREADADRLGSHDDIDEMVSMQASQMLNPAHAPDRPQRRRKRFNGLKSLALVGIGFFLGAVWKSK